MEKYEFYLNKYLIAGYDYQDRCLFVVDNCVEFAKVIGRSKRAAAIALHRLYNGEKTKLIYNHRQITIYFLRVYKWEIREWKNLANCNLK